MDRTIQIPVKIGGETRAVEYRFSDGNNRGYSDRVFGARIGNGAKIHRSYGMAIRWATVEEARKFSFGSRVHEIDGSFFTVRMDSVIHNKQARIVAWADSIEGSSMGSQWNSSARI